MNYVWTYYCLLYTYIYIYICTLQSITLCACVHTQILRQHRKQSTVKSKPVEFNFQSSQIVGKVQRVTGKKWKASLEGSAQVSSLLALTMWLAHSMLVSIAVLLYYEACVYRQLGSAA